VTTGTG